jgi:hypothetical protein
MMFEEFAPSTAQTLDRLYTLRNRVLGLMMAGGSVCALIRAAWMLV